MPRPDDDEDMRNMVHAFAHYMELGESEYLGGGETCFNCADSSGDWSKAPQDCLHEAASSYTMILLTV